MHAFAEIQKTGDKGQQNEGEVGTLCQAIPYNECFLRNRDFLAESKPSEADDHAEKKKNEFFVGI